VTAPHTLGSREEWLAARLDLLEAEKGLTRHSDEVARRRRDLPWVQLEKDYRFATEDGDASLRDLFGGRSQMLVVRAARRSPTDSPAALGISSTTMSHSSSFRVHRSTSFVGSRRSAAASTMTST